MRAAAAIAGEGKPGLKSLDAFLEIASNFCHKCRNPEQKYAFLEIVSNLCYKLSNLLQMSKLGTQICFVRNGLIWCKYQELKYLLQIACFGA